MHGTWCFEQEPCVPIKQTWNDMWTCNHKPWTQPFFNVLFGMIFTYFHIVCCNEHAGFGMSCVQRRSEWNGWFFFGGNMMCCNIVRKHFWEKQNIDMVPCQYISPWMDFDIVWTYISDRPKKRMTWIYPPHVFWDRLEPFSRQQNTQTTYQHHVLQRWSGNISQTKND